MSNKASGLGGTLTHFWEQITGHIPPVMRDLAEMEISSYFLSKVDLAKFVGSLSDTLFAALNAAVEARKAKG